MDATIIAFHLPDLADERRRRSVARADADNTRGEMVIFPRARRPLLLAKPQVPRTYADFTVRVDENSGGNYKIVIRLIGFTGDDFRVIPLTGSPKIVGNLFLRGLEKEADGLHINVVNATTRPNEYFGLPKKKEERMV